MVLDARAFDTDVIVVAHLALVIAIELAPQEGGHVVDLDRVDGGTADALIDGLEIVGGTEDDVGGVFGLHKAPVIQSFERDDGDRTTLVGVSIQHAV